MTNPHRRMANEGPPDPDCEHRSTAFTSSRWWCPDCGKVLEFGETSFVRRLKAYYSQQPEDGGGK